MCSFSISDVEKELAFSVGIPSRPEGISTDIAILYMIFVRRGICEIGLLAVQFGDNQISNIK